MRKNDMSVSEARFTQPTSLCPRPDLWLSVDADATEIEVSGLVAAMVQAHKPDLVIETGTYTAQTTLLIGHELTSMGNGSLITFEKDHRLWERAINIMDGLPVQLINADTTIVDFGQYLNDGEKIDFAWLDSSLDARPVELEKMRPYLSERAVIMVHDTAPHHPVRSKLDSIPWMTWVHIPTPRGVSIGQVKS